MAQSTVIGIDLGGTAIKMGQFFPDGSCLNALTLPTPQPPDPEAVVAAIAKEVRNLNAEKSVSAIGIGTPGPTDGKSRIARLAINLPGWRDIPLADWLEAKLNLPVVVANDANCAGLGESWLGAGRNVSNLILLTLGTGVGGAIILNDELFIGPYGAAGELGLITLNPQGETCNSGNHGSLEQHLCAQAIYRQTQKTPAELGELAQAGEEEALHFWREYGQTLGVGLVSLIYVLTPEAVLIGGGISASAEFFLPTAREEIEKRMLGMPAFPIRLLTAELGNKAGMVGAAKLAWEKVIPSDDN